MLRLITATSAYDIMNFTGCRSASALRTVQVVTPGVQVPTQCCTSLSQQRLCSGIIIGRETTTAFFCQRHSRQSADKNCSWSSRVQSVRPCDVERSADTTA